MNFKEFRESQIAEYENSETGELFYYHEKYIEIARDIIDIKKLVDLNETNWFIDFIFTNSVITNESVDEIFESQPTENRKILKKRSSEYISDMIKNNEFLNDSWIFNRLNKLIQGDDYYKNKLIKRMKYRIPEGSALIEKLSWNITLKEYKWVPVFVLDSEDYYVFRSLISWLDTISQDFWIWLFTNWTIFVENVWDEDRILATIEHEFWHFLQEKVHWREWKYSFMSKENWSTRPSVMKRLKEELLSEVIAWNDTSTGLMAFLLLYSKNFIWINIDYWLKNWKLLFKVTAKDQSKDEVLKKRDDLCKYYSKVIAYMDKNPEKLSKITDVYSQ